MAERCEGSSADGKVTDAGLVPLVQLLCNEMGHAFEARGIACPPWRQAKAMLSKWLPAKVRHRAAECRGFV